MSFCVRLESFCHPVGSAGFTDLAFVIIENRELMLRSTTGTKINPSFQSVRTGEQNYTGAYKGLTKTTCGAEILYALVVKLDCHSHD